MTSPAITTVVKMIETLPEHKQELVVEQLRVYITEMQDEDAWDALFNKTQPQLVAAARVAKGQMASGRMM
jgi:hypothetical protein